MNLFTLSLIVLWAGFVLQASVSHLPLASVRLDIGGVLAIFLGFFVSLGPGGAAVILLGFAQESLGGSVRGVIPLSYLMVYFFQRLSHNHLFFQGGTSQAAWVMILTVLEKSLEGFFLKTQGYPYPYPTVSEWMRLAGFAAVQGGVSLAVFPLLKKGLRSTERYQHGA